MTKVAERDMPTHTVDEKRCRSLLMRRRALRRIFITTALLNIIINLDGGAVPASLTSIEAAFKLEPWQLGLLGALVYIGIGSGSLIVGPLLKAVSPTVVIRTFVLLNTGATASFGLSQDSSMLLMYRFLIGFLQSPLAVYSPCWVDEFAPSSVRTIWMAVIQSGAPLGIMLGYVLGGFTSDSSTFGWRLPFLLQSAVLACFSVSFLCIPAHLYDIQAAAKMREASERTELSRSALTTELQTAALEHTKPLSEKEQVEIEQGGGDDKVRTEATPEWVAELVTRISHVSHADQQTVTGVERLLSPAELFHPPAEPIATEAQVEAVGCSADGDDGKAEVATGSSGVVTSKHCCLQANNGRVGPVQQLLKSPTYILTVSALSTLFFVVCGIQFWVSAYLIKVLNAEKEMVVVSFAIVSIAAPLSGVYVGGAVVDRLGGYKGAKGTVTTLKCCTIFAALAASSAVASCFIPPSPDAFALVIFFLSFTLLFGGAIIPSATGVLINCVQADARQIASASSMLIFNFFGYALSPLVSAIVMQAVAGSRVDKLRFGFRVVMCW
eukprot:CAMPEP_0119309240 /NCGR_PEP_ID=MMETSP1333-20130426/14405_1 /TAXON_ID=418940 /ORGANISM="Scyphosphaera apsteinii, Strain RCC1455" /LENGTH=553 /DNA_ID=CAMNT_0007313177 /DNA_START=38 /DNA_END=1696 /DNA_ORIENTATION=+